MPRILEIVAAGILAANAPVAFEQTIGPGAVQTGSSVQAQAGGSSAQGFTAANSSPGPGR